ncbi:MAG: leucyl/phenylalanyl-tRNA---protein transferase [Myxococcales bacterium]|jgi:leucyl/phenylalanyl-tRNA--protein transferase|nr:leucyl/phenylalanyl-tRNA---protein transferase [Myxococcales bacterium]
MAPTQALKMARRRIADPADDERERVHLPAVDDSESSESSVDDKQAGDEADEWPSGLVAVGGTLDPDRLLAAYRLGIFPWSSDPVLTWWSPDPRAVFDLQTFRPHRTVGRTARRCGWRFTVDRDFAGVMRGCAAETSDRPGTWITEDFIRSYSELHRRGHAHSIEVYEGDELIGGLYGVAIGGFFGGESMFHRRTDASKAAVSFLVQRLRAGGFLLLDAQMPTPHLERLGATTIPRDQYMSQLRRALGAPATLTGE